MFTVLHYSSFTKYIECQLVITKVHFASYAWGNFRQSFDDHGYDFAGCFKLSYALRRSMLFHRSYFNLWSLGKREQRVLWNAWFHKNLLGSAIRSVTLFHSNTFVMSLELIMKAAFIKMVVWNTWAYLHTFSEIL